MKTFLVNASSFILLIYKSVSSRGNIAGSECVSFGMGESRQDTNETGIRNKLKRQAQFIPECISLIYSTNLPQGRRSAEQASADVMWSLSIDPCHLSSAVFKTCWKNPAEISSVYALAISLGQL